MPILQTIPLSLYIHIPWCVKNCPYCDFNSHAALKTIPEQDYTTALLKELESYLPYAANRPLVSIFFGGGTPSLFHAKTIETILHGISKFFSLENIEITLEANPGTIDQDRFRGLYIAGINRLSIGIQSFQARFLKSLGRIHDDKQAVKAVEAAYHGGFKNINLDLMYGLPHQSLDDALFDIETALSFQTTHLSWYQLTIEPNTFFHHTPPTLPSDDHIWQMQIAGQSCLKKAGLKQYEVSAYARPHQYCRHNDNYWTFGDYLGIGAGAHSKITTEKGECIRFSQVKHPKDYLNIENRKIPSIKLLSEQDLIFEFMLNALRLTDGVPVTLFTERTGLPMERINNILSEAMKMKLLKNSMTHIQPTNHGKRYLNNLIQLFLN